MQSESNWQSTNRTRIVLLPALRIDISVRLTRIALEHFFGSGTTIEAWPLPNCDHILDVPTTNQVKKGGGAGGRTWTSDKQIPILMLLYALLQSTNYFVRCSTIWATPACSIISNNPDSIKLTALDIIFFVTALGASESNRTQSFCRTSKKIAVSARRPIHIDAVTGRSHLVLVAGIEPARGIPTGF